MGNWVSKNQNELKSRNIVKNKDNLSQNSDQQENDKKSENARVFESLDEKHRRILNIAIASALKRLESEEVVKAQEEEKKIISSLNRYYQQNKMKPSQVDVINFLTQSQNMTEEDYETILKTLRSHHLFKELFEIMSIQKDFITMFLISVKKKTFKFRDYIYKQFDPPTNFYIIAGGKLFVELNSMGLKPLSKGDHFGLESIIYDSEQGESVKVKSSSAILYEINREEIIKVQQKTNIINKAQIQQLLQQKVIFFNFLDNKQRQNLLSHTVRSTYSKGEIIFEKDYDSNAFYVIKKGYVLIKIPQKKDLILQAGSSFGESSFYQNKGQRQGKAIAYESDTVIYGIGSKTIFKSLGDKLDCAVLQNLQKWAIFRDSSLSELYFTYNFDMQKLLNKFKFRKCQKYQVLNRKGQKIEKIYINVRSEINFIKEVVVFNSKPIRKILSEYLSQRNAMNSRRQNDVLDSQEHQAEQIKFNKEAQMVYSEDIVVTARGSYAYASIKQVIDLIIECIEEPQKHRQQQSRVDLSVQNIHKYAKLSSKDGISTIMAVQKNFQIEIIVKVYHKKKGSSQYFTEMNSIRTLDSKHRNSISSLEIKEVKAIYQYRKIVETLVYPNICGFYKAEEDQNNIYLILQYIKGVTLSEVQLELGIMPDVVIKFYVLKLAFMLDYLHKNGVIYRNLKPQKILIDNKGFPNLYDFKYSKKLLQTNNFRTSTIIGTPHHMSPEIIQKKPYSFETDFWQLGVLLYQLIYEKLPFANDSEDPIQIYKQILLNQPKLKKQNSSTALKGLLRKNPHHRIQSFSQLTKQSYFENFDWEMIENQKMVPPYVPKNKTKRFKSIQIFIKNQNKHH